MTEPLEPDVMTTSTLAAPSPPPHSAESDMRDHSDDVVLRELVAGNLNQLPAFIERHSPSLLAYLRHRLGNDPGVEDVAQETFFRLIRSARSGRFTGACSLKTWLFTIANNCVADQFRRRARKPTQQIAEDYERESQAPGPLASAMDAESRQRVHDLLSQIPAEQAEVLSLKVSGGLTTGEIAEVTGVSVATVKSRLRYGLAKVHSLLLQEERRP